jgi:hypothetical protein
VSQAVTVSHNTITNNTVPGDQRANHANVLQLMAARLNDGSSIIRLFGPTMQRSDTVWLPNYPDVLTGKKLQIVD